MYQLHRAIGKEETGADQTRLGARDAVEFHNRRNICVVAVPPRICEAVNHTADYNQDLLFSFCRHLFVQVLSSIFRKIVSEKMKLCTGIPVMERVRSA